eukprot:gene8837-6220_t
MSLSASFNPHSLLALEEPLPCAVCGYVTSSVSPSTTQIYQSSLCMCVSTRLVRNLDIYLYPPTYHVVRTPSSGNFNFLFALNCSALVCGFLVVVVVIHEIRLSLELLSHYAASTVPPPQHKTIRIRQESARKKRSQSQCSSLTHCDSLSLSLCGDIRSSLTRYRNNKKHSATKGENKSSSAKKKSNIKQKKESQKEPEHVTDEVGERLGPIFPFISAESHPTREKEHA